MLVVSEVCAGNTILAKLETDAREPRQACGETRIRFRREFIVSSSEGRCPPRKPCRSIQGNSPRGEITFGRSDLVG